MTAKQVYEAALIEMNKVEAPSMLLEDFNYFINKAVYQYINKKYNLYDINQQSSDDVRVLKATVMLIPTNYNGQTGEYAQNSYGDSSLYGGIVEFLLPTDYMHILNCICNFKVKKTVKCYDGGDEVQFAARRLTSDMWSQVINNFYMRPTYKRPYFFIHNVNTNSEIPTNINIGWKQGTDPAFVLGNDLYKTVVSEISSEDLELGTLIDKGLYYKVFADTNNAKTAVIYDTDNPNDYSDKLYGTLNEAHTAIVGASTTLGKGTSLKDRLISLPTTITFGGSEISLIEKPAEVRYGNASPVRLEIRYGKDRSVFELDKVYVDYIKTPQHIRLTQEQLDLTEDTSQIMEFPDYVCQEIINELVKLMMENASDPRLQTHIPINQTIAMPAPQGQKS